MSQKNPFTISFSRKPVEFVERINQTNRIIDTFNEAPVTDQIFIITGLRGSGKTVLMSSVASRLEKTSDWYVQRCIPTKDMVHEMAVDLSSRDFFNKAQVQAEAGIPGIGSVSISTEPGDTTDVMKIRKALKAMDKKNKKLLLVADEISDTPQMRDLSSVFQDLIGEELPVYFLGTGIPENIDALKNVKYLTFLYRAPRIEMTPLDMLSMAQRYQEVFDISDEESRTLSKLTMGYSFAFQALGYVYWDHRPVKDLSDLMPEYDRLLAANSYSKIWAELSEKQHEVCHAIAETDSHQISEIREKIGMPSNNFNGYKNRLLHQGIIAQIERGKIAFTLPRFDVFINDYSDMYEF